MDHQRHQLLWPMDNNSVVLVKNNSTITSVNVSRNQMAVMDQLVIMKIMESVVRKEIIGILLPWIVFPFQLKIVMKPPVDGCAPNVNPHMHWILMELILSILSDSISHGLLLNTITSFNTILVSPLPKFRILKINLKSEKLLKIVNIIIRQPVKFVMILINWLQIQCVVWLDKHLLKLEILSNVLTLIF